MSREVSGEGNPFAAPAPRATHRPLETRSGWLGMASVFRVGSHRIEVETGHWTGLEVYRVDDQERRKTRNLGWHVRETLAVGRHEVVVHGRWYPLRPVRVEVDGVPWIDDLFPQIRRPVWVLSAATLGVMLLLAGSTAWDLWRWWSLPG